MQRRLIMRKKRKLVSIICTSACLFLAIASLVGLVFTGMYVGWGPFKNLFWNQEVKRVKKSYSYEDNQEGIVFYGASNFRLWTEMDNDLSDYSIVNAGFGGSTDKLLMQYASDLLYPYHPKVIFFQTGSNDYVEATGTDEEKIQSCMNYKKKMFETFHEKLPEAKMVIMSGLLLPGRKEYTSMTLKINQELEEYVTSFDYLYYVNANELTYDGTEYRFDLFIKDGIHLNHDGQLLWCENYIRPQIEKLILEHSELGSLKKAKN